MNTEEARAVLIALEDEADSISDFFPVRVVAETAGINIDKLREQAKRYV